MIRYNLDNNGYVTEIGYKSNYTYELTNEPFTIGTAFNYQKQLDTGEWIDLKTTYKYIILPCEMIDLLLPLVDEVEDVRPPQFDMLLGSTDVTTRAGNDVSILDRTVRFFICKLLQWDDGDKEQVTGLIDYWNENNPTRLIDFECCFEDDYELESFVTENSITE